jgi:hypothetical protein
MKNHQMFCSACDREVRVMITDTPAMEDQASVHDEEMVCLDVGEQCVGNLCPIGAAAPNVMVSRIMRNGLPLEDKHTVRSFCPSCGLECEMVLYGEGRAACTSCGTAARWTLEHAEPL